LLQITIFIKMAYEIELHPVPEDLILGVGVDAIRQMEAFLRDVYRRGAIILENEAKVMLAKGGDPADVARWVVNARNRLKMEVRSLDLKLLKRLAEFRNAQKYTGAVNPQLGPDYEYLRNKGKTDMQIIESGKRTSTTVNKGLGKNLLPIEGMQTSGGSVQLSASQRLWLGRLKICGNILIFVDIGLATSKYYKATEIQRPHVFLEEGGRISGAIVGGWLTGVLTSEAIAAGAIIIGITGAPVIIIGLGVCAVGAVAGGWLGGTAGKWLADELYPITQTYAMEEK
jgi:hypothetical protein